MMKRSLKLRFTIAVLATTIIALLVSSGAMVAFNLQHYRGDVAEALNIQAELVARAITPALQFGDQVSAQSYLQLFELQPNVVEAAVYNEKGRLFVHYQLESTSRMLRDMIPGADGIRADGNTLLIHKRIIFEDEIIGIVLVRMNYDLFSKTAGNMAIAVVSMAFAVLVAFALSLHFNNSVIGPLLSLTGLARQLAETKDYSLRAEKKSSDEIGYLVEAFNEMLDEVVNGRRHLERSNEELKLEVQERREAEIALKGSENEVLRLNAELEQRVQDRTFQLELANKELESFSYSVSHDLRSPLRAIDGFSQALLEDYGEQIDDMGRDYLGRVRAAAQKMGNLIDDMLKLSRVSRAEMNLQKVDLSAMAENIWEDLHQDSIRDAKIKITSGLTAFCDPHLMRIALTNLLNNAWKYTSKIPAAKIEFGMRLNASDAAFFVQDNGAGFDMTYADKLFGAFQRMHTAGEFPGTGIGLATVKRVVSRHGGRVWADAALNKGATFYFTLPTKEPSHSDLSQLDQPGVSS
jgi:signal transduction histidine kinase